MTIGQQSKQTSSDSELTSNQKKLEEELLSIFDKLESNSSSCVSELREFLSDNENDEDLKFILDNSRDENGETWLHYAIKYNRPQAVEFLLKAGANPNVKDQGKNTLLHRAVRYGYTEVAKALINSNVEVNEKDRNGYTPLHWAVTHSSIEVVKALMENGAEVNAKNKEEQTPLHWAARYGHTEVVKALIENEAEVNAFDENGYTPLHWAARYGHTEAIEVLIDKGAKVDQRSRQTLLEKAVKLNHTSLVQALVKKGIDVCVFDENEGTILHWAAEYGHTEIVKALMENGAEVNAKNKEEQTPLHWAAGYGHTEVVKALIENGAEVNAFDENGYTPLHWAAKYAHTEAVEVLIDKGAKVNALDQHSRQTLLEKAVRLNYTSLVQTLVENGADVNAMDNGKTLLCYAVESDHKEIATLLMNKGADPLLVKRNAEGVKYLVKLIKSDILKCPEKVEKTQQEEKQINDEYEFIKCSLLSDNSSLIDVVQKDTFDSLICKWFADVHTLTDSQKKLNTQLLILLKDFLYHNHSLNYYNQGDDWDDSEKCNVELIDFLEDNRSNEDLETILNLQRGESQLTILHLASGLSMPQSLLELVLDVVTDPNKKDGRERIPLHYATNSETIKSLLNKGADLNIQDIEGKTPRDIAIDNHNYGIEQYFFTSEQHRLEKELDDTFWLWGYDDSYDEYYDHSSQSGSDIELMKKRLTELKDLLNKYKHENAEDLKRVLNLRDSRGESKSFQNVRNIFWDKDLCKEAESLLLEAGAIDYKEIEKLDRKEHSPKLGMLWDNLIKDQQGELEMFVGKVEAAQNMNELEQVVDEAIKSGLAFNFPHQGKLYDKMYESKYSFADCMIRKIKGISESDKNPKLASDIVCKLISKGARLNNICSLCVFDELEKFEGHKANMKKAHEDYVHRTLEFMKVVKSAVTGKVKDAKVDNSTLYLEYSEDSTIHVAKITDGARDLGLTQGETGYGRDVIKIGKSEVEIITANGIRHYTDLADGSDIVLTFYTNQGKLEVRLYPDKENKDQIRIEVEDQEMWKKLKDCEEEIGKNCRFGRLLVKEAIEQRFFTRSGKLVRSEEMSSSKKVSDKVKAAVEGLKPGDIVGSPSSEVPFHVIESIQRIQSREI